MIASVWEVADEPSNQLLPAFYRAWLGGATKAAALRAGAAAGCSPISAAGACG